MRRGGEEMLRQLLLKILSHGQSDICVVLTSVDPHAELVDLGRDLCGAVFEFAAFDLLVG
jgi:hypothetical protein